MLRGRLSVGLFAVTVAAAARADPTVDAFVAEVLARNGTVTAAAQRKSALRSDARSAVYWSDPTLAVMADYVPAANDRSPMPMLRYQVTQTVPWPGKLGLVRDAYERAADGAGASLDARKLELTLQTKRAFFMLVLNAQERYVNRSQRALMQTIAAAALGRYASGTGGHHEVARAEVEVQSLDVEHLALEGERVAMVAMLDALRDLPPDAPIPDLRAPVWTPVVALDAARLADAAVARRPELRGMTAMRDEARTMARLARREPYPDLMVGAWVNQMLAGEPPSFGGMIGVTLPVFSGPRAHHRAEAFDQRADAAGEDGLAMRAMVRAEVTSAVTRFATASREVDLVVGVALPKSHESFDASLAGFGTGTVDIVGVLEARRSLQTLELALARARVMREIAFAEVERSVGGPVP